MAEQGYELTPTEVDEHIAALATKFRNAFPELVDMTDNEVLEFVRSNVRLN